MLHVGDALMACGNAEQVLEEWTDSVWGGSGGTHWFPVCHPWAKWPGIVISYRHKQRPWLNAARRGRAVPDCQARKGTFAGEALEDLWI
ncbi:hypothetical protein GCM10010404_37390 [Nonomuraea africana]